MYQRSIFEENRKKLLMLLFEQPMDFTSLKDASNLSEPALSRHLQHLLQSKFVEVRKDGRRRIYRITDKGLEELFPHLLGMCSALKAMKARNFEKVVGREFLSVLSVAGALNSFASCISRFVPTNVPQASTQSTSIKNQKRAVQLFGKIVEEMQSDFEELKRMRKLAEEVEERGGDASKIREEIDRKLSQLNAIYYALGPPFSYMWKEMVESSDVLGFTEL